MLTNFSSQRVSAFAVPRKKASLEHPDGTAGRMSATRVVTWLLLMLLAAHGAAAGADACDRDCVIGKVEAYVAAMVIGDATRLSLGAAARSTENGESVAPVAGVWTTIAARGSYSQVFVDDGGASAVFFGAFRERTPEGDAPLLMAIRFRFEDGAITELEHLLSRPDWRNRLILRHELTEPNPVYERVLPMAERRSRDELIRIAHAYFDGIAASNDEAVPVHPECNRRENGVVLLRNPNPATDPCPLGFHRFNYITDVRDRRVAVVDEARGLVLMFAFFDVPGNIEVAPRPRPSDAVDTRKIPRSLYIAELFRVVDGRIRDIEAIMFNLDLHTRSGWDD